MEGISTLLVVMLVGAALLGFMLGMVMPARRGLAALIVALLGFVAMAGQHLRLNGAPEDASPFLLYAIFALIASVPGLIGAFFGSRMARKKV